MWSSTSTWELYSRPTITLWTRRLSSNLIHLICLKNLLDLLKNIYNTCCICRSKPDSYLKSLTRDNVQLLINKIWELPVERVEEAIVATLPKPEYILPRSRVIPKPKPLTKWQQFAKEKGIQTKKKSKSKLKWDEELKARFIFTFKTILLFYI